MCVWMHFAGMLAAFAGPARRAHGHVPRHRLYARHPAAIMSQRFYYPIPPGMQATSISKFCSLTSSFLLVPSLQVRSIMGQVRPDRQTLLFSATMPRKVRNVLSYTCVRCHHSNSLVSSISTHCAECFNTCATRSFVCIPGGIPAGYADVLVHFSVLPSRACPCTQIERLVADAMTSPVRINVGQLGVANADVIQVRHACMATHTCVYTVAQVRCL